MARDPPSPTPASTGSELRDLSLVPSSIRGTKITIVHPQLRDLILPLSRGRVLYPRENTVEEYAWEPTPDLDEEDDRTASKPSVGARSTVAKLSFTPNCLTVRSNILACGGQHGQLYLCTLPHPYPSSALHALIGPHAQRFEKTPLAKPFALSETLPKHAINNSLTILPSPEEWHRQRRSIHDGRRWVDEEEIDDEEYDYDDEDAGAGDMLLDDDEGEEEDDDEMDVDEDDEGDHEMEELDEFPSPSSSVATYPNTVPFVHPPRLPHLPPSQPAIEIPQHRSANRRAASFGSHSTERARTARASFSSSLDRTNVQYVTALPGSSSRSVFSDASIAGSVKRKRKSRNANEPRLLISNNDQTVKMFSLQRAAATSTSNASERSFGRYISTHTTSARSPPAMQDSLNRLIALRERGRLIAPPPPPRFGSSYGWDSVGINAGIQAGIQARTQDGEETLRIELARAREHLRNTQETLQREREEFERRLGVNIGSSNSDRARTLSQRSRQAGLSPSERERAGSEELVKERRKLAEVGGTKFKYAINHSSLSPDMKTMVSVGDSTDVYLFSLDGGGRGFRPIGVYESSGKGFSTSWSKDGRKFAVASEDGQVTVWDHRSSRPLAVFHTSPVRASPSFSADLSTSRMSPSVGRRSPQQPTIVLYDPVTGESSTGSSTSGREAARVVKFSPEGSSRDLMVFTEENSNLHIVDARTLNTHVVVPVPYAAPNDSANIYRDRGTTDDGQVGIAGVAFDPTGDWLYSGTERTVVEWDLRRMGGGEAGTWGMA